MMLGEDEAAGDPGSFGSKSVWARISVIAAGPVFNFILAFLLAVVMVKMSGYDPAVITGVVEGYPAQEAGVQEGDIITKMNGKTIHFAREVSNYIAFHQAETINLTCKRDGETYTVSITPKANEGGRYVMGVSAGAGYVKANLWQSIKNGLYEVRYVIDITFASLKMLITGQAGIKDMSGPVGVVDMIGETYTASAQSGWYSVMVNMLSIAVLLSANLGVMNLLPIPALDGGRLVFLILEVLRGKRIDPEKEAMVHFAGLMLLMVLMIVVMGNDITRIVQP